MKLSLFGAVAVAAAGCVCSAASAQTNQPEPAEAAMRFVSAPVVNVPAEAQYAMPIVMNTAAFEGGSILLPLDVNQTVIGTVTKTQIHSDISTGWSGTLEGVEYGSFSFVEYDGAVHGVIWAGELGTFEVRDSGQDDAQGNDIYNLIRFDMSKFADCGNDQIEQHGEGAMVAATNRSIGLAKQMSGTDDRGAGNGNGNDGVTIPGMTPELDDGSVIDVMIVYTAEARSGWGGTSAILALAQNSINTTNLGYSNSDIGPLVLNLVHTEEVVYTESGSAGTDITRLRGTNDGFMDNVHSLRDTHAADLVAMLVNSFNACGVGYLAPFDAAFGFTVTDTGCAVGNLTFAHEIGHNMGATHDRNNAGGAVFSYAYGWRWNSTNGVLYRSVMAYSPGSRVPYFSNPDINYIGTPTGVVNSEDNARCHDNTRDSVANFRDSNGCITFGISGQPDSQTACPGDNIAMSAFITGNLSLLTFEWRKDNVLIAGAISNVLQLNNVDASDAGSYVLTVIEPCSSETTAPAVLTVSDAVAITQDPQSQTVDEGDNASFTVIGTGLDTYQWFGPVGLLLFEESATLNLTSVTQADAGDYYCFVSGACDPAGLDSATATLTVNTMQDCLADVNGDGMVTPTDFTAWVNAFNNNLPECDQNGDGACTPTDFTAWVANFNAGCP
ncbi:MAG: hypothetical protein COB69_03180 [Phycisphaera sp.]|nr:MAG: hypothetical protein COB69_03180 [Phycisphaera sp.]